MPCGLPALTSHLAPHTHFRSSHLRDRVSPSGFLALPTYSLCCCLPFSSSSFLPSSHFSHCSALIPHMIIHSVLGDSPITLPLTFLPSFTHSPLTVSAHPQLPSFPLPLLHHAAPRWLRCGQEPFHFVLNALTHPFSALVYLPLFDGCAELRSMSTSAARWHHTHPPPPAVGLISSFVLPTERSRRT